MGSNFGSPQQEYFGSQYVGIQSQKNSLAVPDQHKIDVKMEEGST